MLVRPARRRHRLGGVSHRWPLAVLLAAASLSSAGCSRGEQSSRADQRVDLTWTLRPATAIVGPATLTLALRASSGGPITGAAVRIEGHMTHPGMAPLMAEAVERAPGVYESAFAFTMPGDWVLLVAVRLPDGTRVERRIDVANVRPSG
jgi:hypothetical protein